MIKVVASNLTTLRKKKGLTQFELAEQMNYSDKSVSKWERGEGLPDLATLQALADFYDVTLDYLTHEINEESKQYEKSHDDIDRRNKIIICALWILGVLTIASVAAGALLLLDEKASAPYWIAFIWSLPGIFLVLVLFTYKNKSKVHCLAYQITFIWSLLLAIYLEMVIHVSEGYNLAFVFVIGIPITFILVLRNHFSK